MTKSLLIDRVSAHYGRTRVLEDLSLDVAAGEFVSLLGASGCGKTTTLRLVAGFLEASGGRILLGDKDIGPLPPHRRDIGLVFQNYALFPHLTVAGNVGFGLRQRRVSAAETDRLTAEMLERVGLAGFGGRLPAALSGGQKQRVALARALVIRPSLLMFDEPLSNLDAKLRVDMRVEIRQLQQQHGTTAIYVTHDQEEAFSISDRVAIMDAGRISQLDTPERLYRRPANAFVARFVGFENLVRMQVTAREGQTIAAEAEGGVRLTFDQTVFGHIPDRFLFAARADGLAVVPPTGANQGIPATVGLRTYLGRSYQYRMRTPVGPLVANGLLANALEAGDNAVLVPAVEQCWILEDAA